MKSTLISALVLSAAALLPALASAQMSPSPNEQVPLFDAPCPSTGYTKDTTLYGKIWGLP